MKRLILKNIVLGTLAVMAAEASAQLPVRTGRKVLPVSATVRALVPDSMITVAADAGKSDVLFRSFKQRAASGATRAAASDAAAQTVLVECADAETLAARLNAMGMYAVPVGGEAVAVTLTAAEADLLEAMPEVERIRGGRRLRPRMMQAQEHTRMAEVYAGTGLETPFTGEGVIVAVIDQGFEYNHPAFRNADGTTRVKRLWNRYQQKALLTSEADITAQKHDGTGDSHATHVSGIAAGSAYSKSFRGNAPAADLVFIPSSFGEYELVQDVNYIKAYADSVGKPAVINFSAGSQVGGHNGEGSAGSVLDRLLGKGLVFCQAAGNEGDYTLHASKKLSSATDRMKVMVDCQDNEAVLYFMAEGESSRNMQISFSLLNINTLSTKSISSTTLNRYFRYGTYEAGVTGRPDVYVEVVNCSSFMNLNTEVLVVSVGLEAGATLHGWVANPGYGEFLPNAAVVDGFTSGDNLYNINPEAKQALQIAAFDNCNRFRSLSGYTMGADYFEPGGLAYYSNSGPVVGEWMPMPLVAAPGSLVNSAFSKYDSEFSASDNMLTLRRRMGGEDYYYGMMSGTSMSCPQVAGIIACWMQAYPQLDAAELTEIIAQTAINDDFTGNVRENWDSRWGYGKIDAYEGLKECLRRASNSTAINDLKQSAAPLTLRKESGRWKVLFNSEEPYAEFRLTTAEGRTVFVRRIANVACAQEEVIDFSACPPGVYLLTVRTMNYTETKKFVR
jgi:subtilase family domain protein